MSYSKNEIAFLWTCLKQTKISDSWQRQYFSRKFKIKKGLFDAIFEFLTKTDFMITSTRHCQTVWLALWWTFTTFCILFSTFCESAEETRPLTKDARKESPDLVVMGGDSCYEGCGFESQHHLLNRHFSHIFVVKMVMFLLWSCGRYYNSIFPTFRRIKSRRLIEVLPVLTTANDWGRKSGLTVNIPKKYVFNF